MEKLTFKQIIAVLEEKLDGIEEFAFEDFDTEELGLGEIELVDEHGGEDQGSDWWVVFNFKAHDLFIKVNGYYASYSGTEFEDGWDSCSEVTRKQKLVDVWD